MDTHTPCLFLTLFAFSKNVAVPRPNVTSKYVEQDVSVRIPSLCLGVGVVVFIRVLTGSYQELDASIINEPPVMSP